MTILDTTASTPLEQVTFDLYRDIHKAIRSELFVVTLDAGRLDPADRIGADALAAHVVATVDMLIQHAEHEDGAIQPVLEIHLTDLADQVAVDHVNLERRMERLVDLAETARGSVPADTRGVLHHLYVELAAFTSSYLAHQDLEERVVMPRLERAVGVETVIEIHGAILGAMPPEQMMASLALMFPAMNIDDRTELLGGMRATAPAEAFGAVRSLASSVLSAADAASLEGRLDP